MSYAVWQLVPESGGWDGEGSCTIGFEVEFLERQKFLWQGTEVLRWDVRLQKIFYVLWRVGIKSFIGQSQDFEDYSVLDRKPVKFFKNRGNVIVFAGTSE